MYNTQQQYAAQPVTPQFTGQTLTPQFTGQTVSPQFTGQTAPFPHQGYPPQPQQAQQPQQFVAELSTQKSDGQVHEMATTR